MRVLYVEGAKCWMMEGGEQRNMGFGIYSKCHSDSLSRLLTDVAGLVARALCMSLMFLMHH